MTALFVLFLVAMLLSITASISSFFAKNHDTRWALITGAVGLFLIGLICMVGA